MTSTVTLQLKTLNINNINRIKMKNNNENLIYISKSIIENLDLKNYISHAKLYKSDSLGKVQINDLKKEALKLATNEETN
jgi:hypothetical protein